MIKIDFEFESSCGIFKDALYLSEDHTLTSDEIESMKRERFESWVNFIDSVSAEDVIPEQQSQE
jgi:hypothetical protein